MALLSSRPTFLIICRHLQVDKPSHLKLLFVAIWIYHRQTKSIPLSMPSILASSTVVFIQCLSLGFFLTLSFPIHHTSPYLFFRFSLVIFWNSASGSGLFRLAALFSRPAQQPMDRSPCLWRYRILVHSPHQSQNDLSQCNTTLLLKEMFNAFHCSTVNMQTP